MPAREAAYCSHAAVIMQLALVHALPDDNVDLGTSTSYELRRLQAQSPPPPPPLPPGQLNAPVWNENGEVAILLVSLFLAGGFMVSWVLLMGRFRRRLERGVPVANWEVRFFGGRKKTALPHTMPAKVPAVIDRTTELRVGRGAPIKV